MKKIGIILLALSLFSCSQVMEGSESALDSTSRAISAPVSLVSAKSSFVTLGSAVVIGQMEGRIEVANYSNSKSVGLVYNIDNSGWETANAYYVSTLDNGRELWDFSLTLFEDPYGEYPASRLVQFALFMDANGESYWDNNNNGDYFLSTWGGEQVYSNVVLGTQPLGVSYGHFGSVYPAGTVLTVSMDVKNLSYHKNLQLVYTTDNWATVKTAPAYFRSTLANGAERWEASPVIDQYIKGSSNNTYTEEVKFCVAYTVNGVTYWDNNKGENYTLKIGKMLYPWW